MSDSARVGAAIAAATMVVALIAVGLWWLLAPADLSALAETEERITEWIRAQGAWGVAASVGLMVVHSFVPFPAEIVACANGAIYGPFWGTVITWVGAMLGAVAAFGLARLLGWPFVRRILPSSQLLRLEAWSTSHGTATLLISRFIPVIAFNLINYGAALTGISWWTFLWTTGVGILPLTALFVVLGDQMVELPEWVWLLASGLVLLAWLGLHRLRKREKAPPGL